VGAERKQPPQALPAIGPAWADADFEWMSLHGLIGGSPAFQAMARQIAKIARTDACVLIEGETGVGKEISARAIHYLGDRRSKPFVPLNCGAIPEALVESELFGHARGAFTDAKVARAGVIAQAHGGTLFLDEVDALPWKGQVALLRFLQDRRYRPVGHTVEHVSDARILAATNRPLAELVEQGAFRSDLMYRLNIIRLPVPALRERRPDIVLLARHYLRVYCDRYGFPARSLHPVSWQWMMRYDWPGNVRELESLIHRSVLLCEAGEILFEECADAPESARPDTAQSARLSFQNAKAIAIAQFEHDYLSQLLEEARGSVSAAARLACKERRSLGKLLKKHGIGRHAD
jgi:two-component system response regulator GlrR